MEQLKHMKESLTSCVQAQMADINNADAKELGEAVDMIKDLSEAIYYCTVTKAMEDGEKEKELMKYVKPIYYYNEMSEERPRYYSGDGRSSGGNSSGGSSSSMGGGSGSGSRSHDGYRMYFDGNRMNDYPRYMEESYPMEIRDYREGKSPMTRRMYMESKELHHDKAKQMQELQQYMKELTEDITEMISDASPEEKEILSQKLSTLASKVK